MLPIEERRNWSGSIVLEGSQWHILESNLVDLIVENKSEICRNFVDVLVPDEHAFQWIISKTSTFSGLRRSDHVFMQWEGPSPKRLSFSEIEQIIPQGQFLFARKAQTRCTMEQWISWAGDRLANGDGARWLQDASSVLRMSVLEPGPNRVATSRALYSSLLEALLVELSDALGGHIKLEKLSEWRSLIDTGREHSSGARLFFLCFAGPSLGITVVPALRHADLTDENPIRSRPRLPCFGEFVSIPIAGHVGWSITTTTASSDCKELVHSVLTEL
jgi:hypothetical protein